MYWGGELGGQEAGLWLPKEHLYFGQIRAFPKLCFWAGGFGELLGWDAGPGGRMLGGMQGMLEGLQGDAEDLLRMLEGCRRMLGACGGNAGVMQEDAGGM